MANAVAEEHAHASRQLQSKRCHSGAADALVSHHRTIHILPCMQLVGINALQNGAAVAVAP